MSQIFYIASNIWVALLIWSICSLMVASVSSYYQWRNMLTRIAIVLGPFTVAISVAILPLILIYIIATGEDI